MSLGPEDAATLLQDLEARLSAADLAGEDEVGQLVAEADALTGAAKGPS